MDNNAKWDELMSRFAKGVSGVRNLPAVPDRHRVETGAIQFGEDWPGVFIRGDNAIAWADAVAEAARVADSSGKVLLAAKLFALQACLELCDLRKGRDEPEVK